MRRIAMPSRGYGVREIPPVSFMCSARLLEFDASPAQATLDPDVTTLRKMTRGAYRRSNCEQAWSLCHPAGSCDFAVIRSDLTLVCSVNGTSSCRGGTATNEDARPLMPDLRWAW